MTSTDQSPKDEQVSDFPRIVSVDDHVVEPPHLWKTWLPAKFKEHGPRIERHGLAGLKFLGGTQ